MQSQIILRLSGETTIKSPRVRSQFNRTLRDNIRRALKANQIAFKLEDCWARLYVNVHPEDVQKAVEVLKCIFGIYSISPVEHQCASDIEQMAAIVKNHYMNAVANKKFAVNVKRTGQHSFTSMDVEVALGSILNQNPSATVSLKSPDFILYLEIRDEITNFFSAQIKGPGGFPLTSGGKALCLISGGFDSSVAAWMMQKRGIATDYLLLDLGGKAYTQSVMQLVKELHNRWGHGSHPYFHRVDFSAVSQNIKTSVKQGYAQVILKRCFMRAAEKIADRIGIQALVTGEAIGQVSSQTLGNLSAIDAATDKMILRPLLTFEKADIIALAKQIGTYELNAPMQEFCQLVPDRPVTNASAKSAEIAEANLDLSLLEKAVNEVESTSLYRMQVMDFTQAMDIKVSEVPEGAVLIDCRDYEQYESSHLNGAKHCEFHELMSTFNTMKKQDKYVIYCDNGTLSALAAQKMQSAGYLAYSLEKA